MRVEKKVLCRGEAKIFILLAISDCKIKPNDNNLYLFSETKEGSRPVEWAFSTSLGAVNSYEIFCIIPQSKLSQKIVIQLRNDLNVTIDGYNFIVEPKTSSIKSKYYGVKSSDSCQLVRNIDCLRNLNNYDLKIEDLSYAIEDKWLIHFSIDMKELSADCLDGYCWVDSLLSKPQTVTIEPLVIVEENSKRAHFVSFFSAYMNRIAFGVFNKSSNTWCAFDAIEQTSFKPIKKAFAYKHQNASFDPTYNIWFKNKRISQSHLKQQMHETMEQNPMFSVLVPLYKTPVHFFIEMIESVLRQSYSNWELILINASSEDGELFQIAEEYAKKYKRVIHHVIPENLGITENTNIGIAIAHGDYLCFFDHDDVLEPDILFEYAKAINSDPEIGLLYCDEDKLLPNGVLGQPTFKPDFNLDLLRDNNYICHMLTVKKSIHSQLEKAEAIVDGAQDYSLTLQMAETGVKFHHVSKILYHWRISENSTASNSNSKPYATQAGIIALQNHLDRIGISAIAENSHGRNFRYKVNYDFSDAAISLIMIPNSTNQIWLSHLKTIAESLSQIEYEILVVADDGVVLADHGDISIKQISCKKTESFAERIKKALDSSKYENILIFTKDICFEQHDWIYTMLGHLSREEVAIVGPMICDVAGMVQEAGRAYLPNAFVPLSSGIYKEAPGYIFRPLSTQNVSLVGSHCFATKKSLLKQCSSLESNLNNDCFVADFCFECKKNNKLTVYTPEVTAVQYCEKHEVDFMDAEFMCKWSSVLSQPDPCFNPNFSEDPYWASQYALGGIQ